MSVLSIVRRRPSAAFIVATLALFVSLSGTAMAAVIITSNGQVAAHTIAGARAPSGDNKNLIAGSVGTTDLHAGSVTPAKLAADSRAHRIDFSASGTSPTNATLLSLDELTLTASCDPVSATIVGLTLHYTSSVTGDVNYSWDTGSGDGGVAVVDENGLAFSAGQYGDLMGFASDAPGSSERSLGSIVYRNSVRTISVTFSVYLTWYGGYCEIHGIAVQASSN